MDKDKTKTIVSTAWNQKSLQTFLFNLSSFPNKKVEVQFTTEQISTDGGLLLLKEVDRNIGLIDRIAACLEDNRHQSYVKHDIKSLLNQRIMQIAAGYEDGNDCNSLRNDGVLKVCCEKENSLSAQPTMSRFENSLSPRELYKISQTFANQFIVSYAERPEVIILDCDDTNAQAYGDQQLSLFNQY